MLVVKDILEHPEETIQRLAVKHFDAKEAIGQVIALDEQRRTAQQSLDASLNQQKKLAAEIGAKMKQGLKEEATALREEVARLKEDSIRSEEAKKQAEEAIEQLLLSIPNTPHSSVPEGNGADDNEVVEMGGQIPKLADDAIPHWELAKKYDLVDFELGVKITGAGFPVYKKQGARLQRALISFFLDRAIAAGYEEIEPPLLVNEAS